MTWREYQDTPTDVLKYILLDISQNYTEKNCVNAIEVGIIGALNKVFGKK